MTQLQTETLILGATFYGCGLAKAIPNSLIIDSSIALGNDYSLAFDPGEDWQCLLKHPAAGELRSELLKRRALTDDGKLLTGALAPVMAEWCTANNVKPLLGMELISKKGNIFTFTDFGGQTITVKADRVIDARCRSGKKTLLTFVIHSEQQLAPGVYDKITVSASPIEKIYYGAIELERSCNMLNGRKLLRELWDARPAELRSALMMWGAMRLSQNSFANPAAALDAGLSGTVIAEVMPDTPPPEKAQFDTVVVGLGTAGIIAAISAARRGAKVLAIEKNYYPGGVWTGGFVHRSYLQQTGGIAKELQDRSEQLEGYFSKSENLRTELECAALDAGVVIEYGAVPASAEKINDRLTRITYRDHDGKLTEVSAYTFIDCSADAVLCRMAGCTLNCGRQEDMEFNSYTNSMGILIDNVFFVSNFDAGRVAQYDHKDFSQAFLSSARLHLRDDYTQGRPCIQISDNPGVREGLRIVPAKAYTLEDYFNDNGECAESLFTVISNLDTHAQDLFFESEAYQDWTIAASCWEVRISIPVPRQILFPGNVKGLIAAARHLGIDHDLGNAVRMISGMTAIGEAAGNIAYLAQQDQVLPHEVAYEKIQPCLPENPGVYSTSASHLNAVGSNQAWHSADDEAIKQLLQSDNPALGIWNVKQQNKPTLAREVLQSSAPGSNAAKAATFALALCNDSSVIPQLTEIVKANDTEPVNMNMRYSAERRIAAVYLLGRLRRSEAADFLKTLLQQQDDDKFFGHTVAALIKIGDANKSSQSDIGQTLLELASDTSWQMLERLKGPGAALRRSDGLLRLHIARALDRWNIEHDLCQVAASLPLDDHEKWLWQQYKK